MRKLLLILALPIMLLSCQQEGKSVEAMSKEEKNAALRAPFDEDGNIDSVNVAAFEFEETVIDFGNSISQT